jgi:hypothetical protein
MADTSGSRDKSFEALDFIINVLKEHEKSLDQSINELVTVTEQIGNTATGLTAKAAETDEKINKLQAEITNLAGQFANAPQKAAPTTVIVPEAKVQLPNRVAFAIGQIGRPLLLNCKEWADFQVLATHAQALTFDYKEDEKVFRADAVKGNQIITYSGDLPNFSKILKMWLSTQLEVTEQVILEGSLNIPR